MCACSFGSRSSTALSPRLAMSATSLMNCSTCMVRILRMYSCHVGRRAMAATCAGALARHVRPARNRHRIVAALLGLHHVAMARERAVAVLDPFRRIVLRRSAKNFVARRVAALLQPMLRAEVLGKALVGLRIVGQRRPRVEIDDAIGVRRPLLQAAQAFRLRATRIPSHTL